MGIFISAGTFRVFFILLAMGYKDMAKLRGDMPRDCSLRLQAIYNSLNKREKKIADLILKEPDVIPGYTIKKLAKESESSEATIVRFAKRLGYDGYLDMRRKFTAHYDERPAIAI